MTQLLFATSQSELLIVCEIIVGRGGARTCPRKAVDMPSRMESFLVCKASVNRSKRLWRAFRPASAGDRRPQIRRWLRCRRPSQCNRASFPSANRPSFLPGRPLPAHRPPPPRRRSRWRPAPRCSAASAGRLAATPAARTVPQPQPGERVARAVRLAAPQTSSAAAAGSLTDAALASTARSRWRQPPRTAVPAPGWPRRPPRAAAAKTPGPPARRTRSRLQLLPAAR